MRKSDDLGPAASCIAANRPGRSSSLTSADRVLLNADNTRRTTNPDPNQRLIRILQASPEQQAQIDSILEGKKQVEAPTGPLLLTMGQGAKFLGVSRTTLWRIINSGKLRKIEIFPGSFRLRRADLEALAK